MKSKKFIIPAFGMLVVSALLILASCGNDTLSSARIMGTIAGYVMYDDSPANRPSPGLTVTVAGASAKAVKSSVSDAYGYFEIGNLAPGEYTVYLWRSHEKLLEDTAIIPTLGEYLATAAGTEVVDADVGVNGDYRFTYNLEFYVNYIFAPVASSNLDDPIDPDENIIITFSENIDTETFAARISGTSDVTASWSGRTVTIDPVEVLEMGTDYSVSFDNIISTDGVDYFGSSVPFSTTPPGMLLYTNFEQDADSTITDFDATGNIILTFSDTLTGFDASNTNLYNSETTAANSLGVVPASISVSGMTLVIDPTNSLQADASYWVDYRVFGSSGFLDDNDSGTTGSFQVEGAAAPSLPVEVTNFALETDATTVDYDTTSLSFSWTRGTGVDTYRIYAFDVISHAEEVVVGTFTDGDALDYNDDMTGSIVLQNIGGEANFDFDAAPSDATVQPFAWANDITFSIAAVNETGEGLHSTTTYTVDDDVVPTVAVAGTIDAATASGSDLTDTVTLTFSEFLDQDSIEGNITETIIDTDVTIDIDWTNASTITLTVTIPDGSAVISGETITIPFSDQNGNAGTAEVISVP
jgi:hypothetical protein